MQCAIRNTIYEIRILTYEIINLFLLNKPNFRKSQMNESPFITMNYEQLTMNYEIKNEPKTNPIKANFRKAKNEHNFFFNKKLRTKNYE
jgi:hypothetical protein